MSDDTSRWATFSSAFSIVLRLASARIAELGCSPVGDDPKKFVDRGGLRHLENQAAEAAIKSVRDAAYPLILKLFGLKMPVGKDRKAVLARLGQDLARIEKALGHRDQDTSSNGQEHGSRSTGRHYGRKRAATKRRKK
jgi:hypothetical protein